MPRYQTEIRHDWLGKSRLITGNDKLTLIHKVEKQHRAWEYEWLAHCRTEQAQSELQALRALLANAVSSGFETGRKMSMYLRDRYRKEPEAFYSLMSRIEPVVACGLRKYSRIREPSKFGLILGDLDRKLEQRKYSNSAEELQRFISLILNCYSDYARIGSSTLAIDYHVTFKEKGRLLIIDASLPATRNLPSLKEVRYVASRDAFREISLSTKETNHLYDSLVYQLCLAALYLVFKSDSGQAVAVAVFNGWVGFVDTATGNDVRACILSVQAEREGFSKLDLKRVDPKACFRALKGIGSAELHGMVPVAPLARGNRDDPRFVESIEIADHIREGTNVAAIGWEDFEHLIRQIFEKEFKNSGGEVRVTRASRDWGVDAIAFDPDPIRGGKIVIQAKRYTNTVGVSAVRDLYGTVLNEGATKGILVTTSGFGPEAYEFAKGKPLTLLDGSNLLYLLERHGHRAYIDLPEAKRLNPTPLARSLG